MTSMLGLALVVLAVLVLPALAGGARLTAPSGAATPRPGVLLARCLACGLATWLLTAGFLVRTVGISGTSTIVAAGVLAAVSLGVLLLPTSREVLRTAGGEAAYLGAAVGLALLAWSPLGLLVWAATSVGSLASTPWYYWGLARQVLESGHFPETSVEFGERVPFLADYPLFSASTAMVMAPLPESAHPEALAVVVTVGVVVLGCAAALLARAWGAAAPVSLVAAPLAVTLGIGAYRLLGYRPEGFALGPSLLVVVLVLDWYRHRERSSLAAATVLAAVVSQVHGIAFLGMAMLLVAATLTVLLTERHRPWPLLRTAAFTGASLLAGFAVLGLAMGRFSGSGTSAGIGALDGEQDPTWAFRKLALGEDPTPAPSASRLVSHSLEDLYEERTTLVMAVLVGAAVVVLASALLRPSGSWRERVRPLVFAVLGAGFMLGVGWLFVQLFETYVPRRTGSQRLFLEATLVVPVFLAGAGAALVSIVGDRGRLRGVVTGVLLAVAVGGGLLSALWLRQEAVDWVPSAEDRTALESVGVSSDAVVLANAYTEGYLHHVTGATALLEGRAPYTFPDQLDRSLRLLQEAKRFYADPAANSRFLDRHDVDYVLHSEPGSFSVTSANTFDDAAGADALRAVPGLREVVSSEGLVVFRYEPEAAEGGRSSR